MTPAASTPYVALLRGINVGGNNPVAMVDLAECFRDAGYGDVRTMLASGNVVFTTKGTTSRGLEPAIERVLRDEDAHPEVHGSPALRRFVGFEPERSSAKQTNRRKADARSS